jgi:hypothetical protein
MPTLEQLEAANKSEVIVYMPYYPKDKHGILPYAITLYNQGFLEGARYIEGSTHIPFAASWYVSKLPAELTRCRIQFDGQADLSYEITILNAEFIDYLIDVIKNSKQFGAADFSQGFYRKLLRFDD